MSVKQTLGRITLLIVALLVVSWLSVPLLSSVLAEVRMLLWLCLIVAAFYGWMTERVSPHVAPTAAEHERELGR